MTSELGPSARALLDAARGGGPDAAAIARMRGKIDAAVSAPVATATTSTVTSSLAGKLGLVALALVVATGAILLATRTRPEVDGLASHEIAAPPPASPATVREPASVAPGIDPAEIEIENPAQRPDARNVAPVARPKPLKTIELAREVELVDRAMTALRRGELRAALAAVRLHATETSNRGQLAEDATAIEIEALCTLRDPNATARLSAFDARWPTSAQRARLTAACR